MACKRLTQVAFYMLKSNSGLGMKYQCNCINSVEQQVAKSKSIYLCKIGYDLPHGMLAKEKGE